MARDNKRLDELGLVLDSDPRHGGPNTTGSVSEKSGEEKAEGDSDQD